MDEIRQDQEIVIISKEIEPIQAKIEALAVIDEPSAKLATDYRSFISRAIIRLKERHQFFKRPITEAGRNIDNEFNSLIEPLEALKKTINGKLLTYDDMKEAEEKKRQEAIKKMAEANNLPAIEIKSEKSNKIRSSMGTTYITKRWIFAIIDEAKIPREWLMLNELKINAEIRSHTQTIKGISICDLKIEGLEICQEKTIGGR